MSTAIDSKSVSLSAIFAPYVAGTTKARASGLDDAGTDLSDLYANIIYGSAAAATGIASEGADLNTLYAKIDTPNYALACNGFQYNIQGLTSAIIALSFDTASSWLINPITSTSPAGGPPSGSLPTGSSKYRLTVTKSGTTSAITTVPTGVWASITSGLQLVGINLSSSTAAFATATITLELQDADGTTISTTNVTLQAHDTGN